MIGWAKLQRGRLTHAWFIGNLYSLRSACGLWKRRSDLIDAQEGEGRRCRACVRALKRDYKRKRGGAIY